MQLVFSHFCFSLSYGTKWHDCSRPRLLFLDWLTSACPALHMSAVTLWSSLGLPKWGGTVRVIILANHYSINKNYFLKSISFYVKHLFKFIHYRFSGKKILSLT